MSEDESHRSVTAYILVAIAFIGFVAAFLGVAFGFASTALAGGIIILLAVTSYGLRRPAYE